MNEHRQKNFIGAFSPPFAVINDFDFLPTLEQKDWIGGVAEAFKVAIIKDKEFFNYLCTNADLLASRNMEAMEQVVKRCAILHLEHIRLNNDPFEFGSARPLDFGHWAGHKLEIQTEYSLGHGQCVSIGMALDSCYAMKKGMISEAELELILDALTRCGLPIWHTTLLEKKADSSLRILSGIEQFREHLGGALNITMPKGIGQKIEVHQINSDLITESVKYLSDWKPRG